jgi:UDP-N-acetylmuramoylalanine--D-glutamate ligase
MNKKLEEYKQYIKNKKVAVLGMGISNTPLIKYLAELGVDLTAFDMAEEAELASTLLDLSPYPVKYHLGPGYLQGLKGFDIIFKTPKVRFDVKELMEEQQRGVLITSEMEVFVDLCPADIFAVTGSDGKTTTTTLIHKILVEAGYKCWLGGNIGIPLLSRIDEIRPTDKVVLELSSFQLHTMKNKIQVAVVTNLSPNHLDVHKDMEEYVDAKKNIFRYQDGKCKLVLNYDNDITRDFAAEAKGQCVFFSRVNPLPHGAYIEKDKIVYKDSSRFFNVMKTEDILLIGDHNIENYLAATAAVIDYADVSHIRAVATTFTGVAHRMEPVRKLKGITFYNDSMASSPTRTIAGLKAFKKKVLLIAGGYDKHIPYHEMGEVLAQKVKVLVLIGQTAPKIEEALKNYSQATGLGRDISIIKCNTLEEAVEACYRHGAEEDAVVLSPASASFDMFKNFEVRGNFFKEIVSKLK